MEDEYRMDMRNVNLNQAVQMKKKAEADLDKLSKRHVKARESWKMSLSKARAKENNTMAAIEYKK